MYRFQTWNSLTLGWRPGHTDRHWQPTFVGSCWLVTANTAIRQPSKKSYERNNIYSLLLVLFVTRKYYILFTILCRLSGYSDGRQNGSRHWQTADFVGEQCRSSSSVRVHVQALQLLPWTLAVEFWERCLPVLVKLTNVVCGSGVASGQREQVPAGAAGEGEGRAKRRQPKYFHV